MQPTCHQCGLMHPPIAPGTLCPLAKQTDSEGQEIDFSGFISDTKKIITEFIKENNLKIEEQQNLLDNVVQCIQVFLEQRKRK